MNCDTKARRYADILFRDFKGDKRRWFDGMRVLYNSPEKGPDLEALWAVVQKAEARADAARPPGEGYTQGVIDQTPPKQAVLPPEPGVKSMRSLEEIQDLVQRAARLDREGPVSPEKRARRDPAQVEKVLEVSRRPSKENRPSRLVDALWRSFSFESQMGVFQRAWRLSMASLDRAVGGARRHRDLLADHLVGDIKDDPKGGPSAQQKVKDGEQMLVLRDFLARHTHETEKAKAALPDTLQEFMEIQAQVRAIEAAKGEPPEELLEAYGLKMRALQDLARVADEGPALPGDLRYEEVAEVLAALEKIAHPDSHTFAARVRGLLDEKGDDLVRLGLLTAGGRRKDYFPHKLIEAFMLGRQPQGSGTPSKARAEQFRGYTKLARGNRRLVDTNVLEVVLEYAVEVERHNALDRWYSGEILRYAVPRKGKKAVGIEGEFSEDERVSMRAQAWEREGKDRTAEWFALLPRSVRELAGATQGVLRAPSVKVMREFLTDYADSGGYRDVNASWGTVRWGLADQSPEVRKLIEGLRDEGWPIPALPEVGRKRFERGRGVVRVPARIAERIEKLKSNPDIYPAELWINKVTALWKRNVTVFFGGLGYYFRNLTGDAIASWRDDAPSEAKTKAGGVMSWAPLAWKIGRYKAVRDALYGLRDPSRIAALEKKAAALEAELRKVDDRIPAWLDKAYSFGVVGSGFTAEEAALGRRRVASLPGLSRFSGLAGEGPVRQAMDKFAPFRWYRAFGDFMAKQNERREDLLRTAKFVRDMVGGMNERQAATLNHQTFINYGALTEFERRWMSRSFVPFWTFFKANAVNWSRAAAARPGRTFAYMASMLGVTTLVNSLFFDDEEEKLWASRYTRHIAQKPHLFLPFNDSKGNPIVLMFDDPLSDALGIVGADQAPGLVRRIMDGEGIGRVLGDAVANVPLEAIKETTQKASPYVKMLVEATTGRDSFTDRRFLQGSESGLEKVGEIAKRSFFGMHRGASDIERFVDRAEKSGVGTAIARSGASPLSAFFRAPDLARGLTGGESAQKQSIQSWLLDNGYAVAGDQEGEIQLKRGAAGLKGVKAKMEALRKIEAKARVRAVAQYAKAGALDDAARAMGDKQGFRSLLLLLSPEERVALRATLAEHGTSIDTIARHGEFSGRK